MRFNLISNISNGAGLERDYWLLRESLERLGHQVAGVPFRLTTRPPLADVNIFLEVVESRFFHLAPRNWVVPNPEWWSPAWDGLLPHFERVLAKTQSCLEIFRAKKGAGRIEFLGWRSMDMLDASVAREPRFLHVAGKSQTKNTQAVLECWLRFRPSLELVVVSDWLGLPRTARNVTLLQRISDAELRRLMNACRFHLMPSGYEGWGHVLHEALAVGAVLLTTDAPPMDTMPGALLVRADGSTRHHSAPLHRVTPAAVFQAVRQALAMKPEQLAERSATGRAAFEREAAEFERNLEAIVADGHLNPGAGQRGANPVAGRLLA